MTRKEIIESIAARTGLDREDVGAALAAFTELVSQCATRGEAVTLRGFGTFDVVLRKGRPARDIMRNTTVYAPPHYTPQFRPSAQLLQMVKYSPALLQRLNPPPAQGLAEG